MPRQLDTGYLAFFGILVSPAEIPVSTDTETPGSPSRLSYSNTPSPLPGSGTHHSFPFCRLSLLQASSAVLNGCSMFLTFHSGEVSSLFLAD